MYKYTFTLTPLLLLLTSTLYAQNYTTYGHNAQRNGLTENTGPAALELLWEVDDAAFTTLGQAVYTFGDRFVTTRVQFSPVYTGILECRDLYTGELLWNYQVREEAIHYLLGFDDYAVYSHDYESDSIYAHSPEDGHILWRAGRTALYFAAHDGAVFTCGGDLLVNGPSGSQSTMRLDRETGEVMWINPEFVAVAPDRGLIAFGDKAYRVTGTIVTDERLLAIDIETGITLFKSDPIPGDGDQEIPMTIGPDGTLYLLRDGGSLFAFRDEGVSFEQLWEYVPENINTGTAGHLGMDNDGNPLFIDGRLKRLDRNSGQVLDTSQIVLDRGIITVDSEGIVFVNDQSGKFFALSPDLQTTLWELSLPGNVYCAPAVAQNGILILAGSGRSLYAYQTGSSRRPLADFTASARKVQAGEPIDFLGQSSFGATIWSWQFPGAVTASSQEQNPQGIIYEQAGLYPVTLIASNALGTDTLTRECMIEVEGMVNNTAVLEEPPLRLFPNPARELLTVEHPLHSYLLILDGTGRPVMAQKGVDRHSQLNIQHLPTGMYIMQCRSQEGVWSRRFLKVALSH